MPHNGTPVFTMRRFLLTESAALQFPAEFVLCKRSVTGTLAPFPISGVQVCGSCDRLRVHMAFVSNPCRHDCVEVFGSLFAARFAEREIYAANPEVKIAAFV